MAVAMLTSSALLLTLAFFFQLNHALYIENLNERYHPRSNMPFSKPMYPITAKRQTSSNDPHHHYDRLMTEHEGAGITSNTYYTIQEVSLPDSNYGSPVYSQVILQHNFGNQYGVPTVVNYLAPGPASFNGTFNRVQVQMSATSFGVQYDRLAHLFLNDVPLWRPSTAEPSGRDIIFNYTKDLSEYMGLFKEDGILKFELDNVVDGSINGEFNVTLTAFYYNYGSDTNKLIDYYRDDDLFQTFTDTEPETQILSISNRLPCKVIPLVQVEESSSPLLFLPDSDFNFSITNSAVSSQTVRCKLRLFISGNNNDEFWYSNILTLYSSRFGGSLTADGPIRVVKVYLNDMLVSLQTPPPVIYTGGISPALWSPVVGLNAFDVEALDVDLTSFLPLLWPSSKASTTDSSNEAAKLRIKVVAGKQNANDSDIDTEPLQNWIATGSLLVWDDNSVVSASGTVTDLNKKTTNVQSINATGLDDPSTLNTKVTYDQNVNFHTTLKITTTSNEPNARIVATKGNSTDLEFNFQTYSEVSYDNLQTYTNHASNITVTSTLHSFNRVALLEKNSSSSSFFSPSDLTDSFGTLSKEVASACLFHDHQTILNMNSTSTTGSLHQDIAITQSQYHAFFSSGNDTQGSYTAPRFELSKYQNGTSEFGTSSTGNTGNGGTDTMVKLADVGTGEYYGRKVRASNGNVVSDVNY